MDFHGFVERPRILVSGNAIRQSQPDKRLTKRIARLALYWLPFPKLSGQEHQVYGIGKVGNQ